MNPRLVTKQGPLKGSVYGLDGEDFSVGRNPANRLSIGDASLSRQHCVITSRDGQSVIKDLESRNGTFVNGVPARERVLAPGDEIQIGNSLFLYLTEEEDETVTTPAVRLDERNLLTGATVVLRNEDSRYLQPDKISTAPLPVARVSRDLRALLKISTALNSTHKLEMLERQLMENMFDVIPVARGAILLLGENPEEFGSVYSWDKTGPVDPFPVSGTVVRRVLGEKIGVLSTDVMEDVSLGASKSLIAAETHSLIAVPLMIFERLMGLIYVDTDEPKNKLDSDHLELMTAIAAISAVSLDNARQMEQLENENRRLREEINIQHSMVGESAPMRAVYRFISR